METEIEQFRKEQLRKPDAALYRVYDLYLERLKAQTLKAEEAIEKIRPELNREMEKVVEARKRRHVIEKLKEKYKNNYNYDLRRMERKIMEEVNRGKSLSSFSILAEEGKKQNEILEEDQEYIPEREQDLVAEYFKQLGIPDPRKKS